MPEGAPLWITVHPDKCLLVFPDAVWKQRREEVMALPNSEKSRLYKRMVVGKAMREEADSAGRVLLSQTLRDWAALDKVVWMVGQGDKFELWSDERWQAQQQAMSEIDASDLLDSFPDVNL